VQAHSDTRDKWRSAQKKAHSVLRTEVGCDPGRAKPRQSQMVLLVQKIEMFGGLRTEGWLFCLRNKVLNLARRPKGDKVGGSFHREPANDPALN